MKNFQSALIAEFIGTFALVFVGICAIFHNSEIGLIGVALAHGLTIAVMASATGAISGGHLNPAVTLAMLVTGHVNNKQAIGYIVSQCFAGAVASGVLLIFLPQSAVAAGTPSFSGEVTIFQAMVVEIMLTFFLVFVIYGTAVDSRAPQMGALFIGLVVILDILAGAPITGAAMNPARHLGCALLGGNDAHISQIWLYWVAPIIGAILAALVYTKFLMEEKK